ncbi:MAG: hypothetical protein FD146_321 [Anaerolineaceae bacterium]|nr:MAG: hypothetical protein FD146_321 [Anaerolineaceae bacterium]
MHNRELSPLDALQKALRLWWLIALLGIAGGLLGWLFTRFQPPRYESSVTLSVALRQKELAAADKLPMSYALQEQYLGPVLALFYSQDVEDKLVAGAEERGLDLGHADFNSQDFRIERLYSRWRIVVRSRDPQTAAALADLWADTVYAALSDANGHALNAERLKMEADLVRRCFAASDFPAANACAGTSFATLAEMDAHLAGLDAQSAAEREAAGGITFALDFSIAERAAVPTEPSLFSRSLTLSAGTAIGLLLGFILSASLPPAGTKRHDQPKK